MIRRLLVLLASVSAFANPVAAQTAEAPAYASLIAALEQAVLAGDSTAYLSLTSATADRNAAEAFARENLYPGMDRVTVSPRFRVPLEDLPEDTGYDLTVEVFSESGIRGQLETWQLEVVREEEDGGWRIRDQTHVDSVDHLRHLSLTPTKQYAADNLVVRSEDLSLTLTGSVFVAETELGVTALVLLGKGIMRFTPQPEAERGQVRIFSGDETLETQFEAAFIRVHPDLFRSRVITSALVDQAVDSDTLREARKVFDEFIDRSFTVDLSDISDRLWSLVPGVGSFLAEVRTRHHGTLTYAQSAQQPEDISLSKRETNQIISLYPSARKRASQGRYFAEDDAVPIDVLDYDITASFEPLGVSRQSIRARPELLGCRIVGTTRLALRVKGLPIKAFSLRLADELEVTSVTSSELGPLLFFRLSGQNNLVVNLPSEIPGGTQFTATVSYAGDLPAQQLEENWIASRLFMFDAAEIFGVGEPRYIYSNRSYWYPQARFPDYATATLQLTVPPGWGVVASGKPLDTNPPVTGSHEDEPRRFSFAALQPTRYLSTLLSRFEDHTSPARQVRLPDDMTRPSVPRADGAVFYDTLAIDAHGTALSIKEIETIIDRTADIASFYAALLGDIPYPTLTVALTDSRLPGGHSPAYFAVMNHELPRQPGHHGFVADRSSQLQQLSLVLPGARDRAPVVGTGSRLEELPRAVAERRARPVLRGALRRAAWGARGLRRHPPPDAALGDAALRRGSHLPRVPARSSGSRAADLPGAGLQQGRHGAAHATRADRRRRVFRRATALLPSVAVSEGWDRCTAAGVRDRGGAAAEPVLRPLDPRRRTAGAEVFVSHRNNRAR